MGTSACQATAPETHANRSQPAQSETFSATRFEAKSMRRHKSRKTALHSLVFTDDEFKLLVLLDARLGAAWFELADVAQLFSANVTVRCFF